MEKKRRKNNKQTRSFLQPYNPTRSLVSCPACRHPVPSYFPPSILAHCAGKLGTTHTRHTYSLLAAHFPRVDPLSRTDRLVSVVVVLEMTRRLYALCTANNVFLSVLPIFQPSFTQSVCSSFVFLPVSAASSSCSLCSFRILVRQWGPSSRAYI